VQTSYCRHKKNIGRHLRAYWYCWPDLYSLRYKQAPNGIKPRFASFTQANARVKLAKTGHGPHSSKLIVICTVLLLFVLFHVLFVCKCVLYYCHRVTIQLQLTNISYHIVSYHIISYHKNTRISPKISSNNSWGLNWDYNVTSRPIILYMMHYERNNENFMFMGPCIVNQC
jgi:hypothetical protein